MASILLGNVKGPQGETGATGATGATGTAATISVGSVSTTAYGNAASVTNSGTSSAAVLDFVIPQGRPGEETTKIDSLTIDTITQPATEFPVPAVGDNGSTLFGKIAKWCSDMTALVATKLNAANVVNNLTTETSGYALDARQGKALSDTLASIGTVYPNSATEVAGAAGGISITIEAGTYIVIMGGATQSSETLCQMNIGGANPWEAPYISFVTPLNTTANFFTASKSYPLTVDSQTTLTLYYTAGWYRVEIFAVRIK